MEWDQNTVDEIAAMLRAWGETWQAGQIASIAQGDERGAVASHFRATEAERLADDLRNGSWKNWRALVPIARKAAEQG